MNAIISTASEKDIAFIAGHEGEVLRAYRCPAGVITIGRGFTMGSSIFAAFAHAKWGRALRMGDTITAEESRDLLKRLVDHEYGAEVSKSVKPRKQHHFGGATSTTFNCGKGALKWKWAQALARGDIAESARLLKNTAVTANGRRLAGLERRRREEADLIQYGRYGHTVAGIPASVSSDKPEILEYQAQLKTLGYYAGDLDGKAGPLTKGAVENFQRAQDLTVDGIIGPATRAALIRALDERLGNRGAAGGGTAAGAGTGGEEIASQPDISAIPLETILTMGAVAIIAAAVIWGGVWLYRNRGRFTGVRVPT